MAPHLSELELEWLQEKSTARKTPGQIHQLLKTKKDRQGKTMPHLTKIRLALKGRTYVRGRQETRGRKPKLSMKMVHKMGRVRKLLVKKADGNREVRWKDVVKAARAPRPHRSTAKPAFDREGIPVQARRPHEKPQRTPEVADERVAWWRKWSHLRSSCFTDRVDLIIDNKKFEVPTGERARKYLCKRRVRFHLRTPSEGLKPDYTKPNRKKHLMNTGGHASVSAGISHGRIVLWHYLPTPW